MSKTLEIDMARRIAEQNARLAALESENARLRERVERLERVRDAADKLRKAQDERNQRARDLQSLAAQARAGGPSGQGVLNEYDRTHPTVWDVGDVTEEICAALAALDAEEKEESRGS